MYNTEAKCKPQTSVGTAPLCWLVHRGVFFCFWKTAWKKERSKEKNRTYNPLKGFYIVRLIFNSLKLCGEVRLGVEKSDSLKPKGPLSDLGEMPGHMFIDAILVARCTLPPLVAGAAHGSRDPSFFLGPLSYILGQDGPTLGAVVVTARTTPASHKYYG